MKAMFLALALGFATAAAAQPMVEWVIPALPTNKPQTAEQAVAGRERGASSAPEVLQPMLDARCPPTSRQGCEARRHVQGGSSDVLTVLVQRWFEKFKSYHPEVSLSIAPPYAGSLGAVELVNEKLDFVFVSRELSRRHQGLQGEVRLRPLSVRARRSYRHYGALDAVGFFVHKDNPLEC